MVMTVQKPKLFFILRSRWLNKRFAIFVSSFKFYAENHWQLSALSTKLPNRVKISKNASKRNGPNFHVFTTRIYELLPKFKEQISVFLRQESTIFCVKISKSIFFTSGRWKLGFFFFIFSSDGPGRVVFEQNLRKINAHQDQKHLT